MRVTVRAPARLHFGFIDLDGTMGRMFGSIGLAISEPQVMLEVAPAHRLLVEGDERARAAALAHRFLGHYRVREGVRISLKETIPAHIGLGSGTQLALSVAAALTRLFSIKADVRELAAVMQRGNRSGIGVGVFEHGGLIVDGGRPVRAAASLSDPSPPPPTIIRHPFPKDWTFVVATPLVVRGLAGNAERRAFCRLPIRSASGVGRLCRSLLMQMLPALLEHDAVAFGRSLTVIQRIVGSWFQDVQGGVFATPQGAEITRLMSRAGAVGVGQSSWGPTVYGMVADEDQARLVSQRLRKALEGRIEATVFLANGHNRGAGIRISKPAPQTLNSSSPVFRQSARSSSRSR